MLVRNILFARFLSPADYAVALTFGVVLTLFEYISNFGHENYMQRDKYGGYRDFQATMQSMIILRGLLIAVFIVIISPYVPQLFDLNDLPFNYALLALVPLLNGFMHLDHVRLHRKQIYTVTTKISLCADISSILVALICIYTLDGYWAFYISFIYRHCAATALSHVFSKRAYEIKVNKTYALGMVSFGIPLLGVGVLKYLGTEMDKALIANTLGLETFTTYMLTLMLVVNGTNFINVALSKIFIRRLSTINNNIAPAIRANGIIYCYLMFPLLIVFGILGQELVHLIFGKQYVGIPFLTLAVCATVGIRSLNQWLNQSIIAKASTKLILITDTVKVFIILAGFYAIYADANLIKVLLVLWVAEIAYYVCLTYFLNKRFPVFITSCLIFIMYSVCMIALSVMYLFSQETTLVIKCCFVVSSLILFLAVFLTLSNTCRNQTLLLIKYLTKPIGSVP